MIKSALQNPLAVLMACLALLVFAAVVVPRMTVDTFPELTPPVLVIGTQAPGMAPTDVEKTITWRLEKFVSATPGIDHVQSLSRPGLSIIYVWLAWGTDLTTAQALVQQQVQFAMSSIPKSLGVVPPFVLQYDPTNAPVLQVAVRGPGFSGPQLYDLAQNVVEPVLEGIAGVASAAPDGGRERQINIVVDPVRAQAHGLSSSDLAAAVARANALLPSGKLLSPKLDANVLTNAIPSRVEDLGDALVKLEDGKAVRLKDVARVEDGGGPNTQAVTIGGQDAVALSVLRVPGGNVLSIVDGVKARLAHIEGLPAGVTLEPIFDQSTFVRATVHGLQRELLQAFVLVSLVILFFLQSWRSVLVAAISVPVSFAIILLVLFVTGQTLNAFTLGGLTLAMGPLVDISVVVLEAVHRRRVAGATPAQAAWQGTSSVALAALAATLCTVAVLLPVVLLEGLARKLFAPLAITVATGMLAGYVVSMLVTPVACRYLLGHHAAPPAFAMRIEAAIARFADGYQALLARVLPVRWYLLGAATVLVVGAVAAAARLPSVFFPELDESMERIYVRFAPGTSLDDANAKMGEMAALLEARLPKGSVELVLTNTGLPGKARSALNSPNNGPHMGLLALQLTEATTRANTQGELAEQARALLTAHFPGTQVQLFPGGIVASVFANGYLAPLVVEVRGDSLEALGAAQSAVMDVARTVPGLRDVFPGLETDYPELKVSLDREVAGLVGVSARDVAQVTLESTLGNINTPGVWVDPSNGQSYFVVTGYDGAQVSDAAALATMPVRATTTGSVLLGSYASVTRGVSTIAVERDRLSRVATVRFQTERRDLGSVASDLEARLKADPRTRALDWSFVGQVDLMRRTFGGLGLALGLAVMVVFMVMTSQFKSLRLPLVILFTVPMTAIGIVLALLLAGQPLSISAVMGVLMVVGIAVSNGILLVDHANRRFLEGEAPVAAMLDAARARVVPILMTSLATIIGLLPTAMGLDPEAATNRPLALAVVGGLASSTVLSLFVVPCVFVVLARRPRASESLDEAAPTHA